MRIGCWFGVHVFLAYEVEESSVVAVHENAKSIQEYATHSSWRYKCANCRKAVMQDLDIRRHFHHVLYVNKPLEKVKGEVKNEQVSKIVPQEVRMKPTQYKEPKP